MTVCMENSKESNLGLIHKVRHQKSNRHGELVLEALEWRASRGRQRGGLRGLARKRRDGTSLVCFQWNVLEW